MGVGLLEVAAGSLKGCLLALMLCPLVKEDKVISTHRELHPLKLKGKSVREEEFQWAASIHGGLQPIYALLTEH